jgi:UDP-N-acetylglucosamine acyltransferase
MRQIHPTAIVDGGARLGADVVIGPYCRVGADVTLQDGVVLDSHAIVTGPTVIGARTRVSPFATVGGDPQDLGYRNEPTELVVGSDCSIREYVTIHRGTVKGGGKTTVGDHCLLMIGTHVAHDCVLGDHVILSNQATLGGHAVLGDYAILGGLAAVQQRTRIGAHAYVGGLCGVTRDVVPFAVVIGNRAELAGINVRGLKRRGYDHAAIHALRAAYQEFFFSEGSRADKIARIEERLGAVPAVRVMIEFLRGTGDRALSWPRRSGEAFAGGEDEAA